MPTFQSRALVAVEAGKPFELDEFTLDTATIPANNAVVRFKAAGICHTDVVYWAGYLPGAPFPAILGHEGSGTIEWLPDDYKGDLKVGDTVLCTFNQCKSCDFCQSGYPASCQSFVLKNIFFSDQHSIELKSGRKAGISFFGQSSFASVMPVAYASMVKVDPSLPLELITAFGCGIQTGFGTVLNSLLPPSAPRTFEHLSSIGESKSQNLSRKDIKIPAAPQTLVVFGLGAVGQGAVIGGKLAPNVKNVVAVDLNDERLAIAKKAGATHTINSKGLSTEDFVKKVAEISADGQGANMVVDASGSPVAIEQGIACLTHRGKLAFVGVAPPDAAVPIKPSDFLTKQLTVTGVILGDSDPELFLPYLVENFKSGAFDVMKDLVKTYKPEEMDKALADSHAGTTIKPVILW